MSSKPVLLDADPALGLIQGDEPSKVDDGLVIASILNHADLELLGITVVFGNSAPEEGVKVAEQILKLKQREAPVLVGASEKMKSAENIEVTPAVRFIAQSLRKGPLTLLSLGPLSNIASVIQNYPFLVKNIREVVMVLGRSPDYHFPLNELGDANYHLDPMAAQIVLQSGVPITLVPLELSSKVTLGKESLKSLLEHRTPSAKFLFEATEVWNDHWQKKHSKQKGFHPWDTVALGYLAQPNLFKCENRGFKIEALGSNAAGPVFSKTYPDPQLNFCYDFKSDESQSLFLSKLIQNLY